MKTFFIIWNPNSNLPPKARFDTREEALAVANRLAVKFAPETFIVCKSVVQVKRPAEVDSPASPYKLLWRE